jgi:hypothetical protein
MASTRNNNMKTEYTLQQIGYSNVLERNMYKHSTYGNPTNPGLPLAGSAPPSHMSRCLLSNNSIDIESRLFGIGSSNLVKSPPKVVPQLNKLKDIQFFKRPNIIVPRDIYISTNQYILPTL